MQLIAYWERRFCTLTFEFFQIKIASLEMGEGVVDKPSYQRNLGKGGRGLSVLRLVYRYLAVPGIR